MTEDEYTHLSGLSALRAINSILHGAASTDEEDVQEIRKLVRAAVVKREKRKLITEGG